LATVAGPGVSDARQNVLGLWGSDRRGELQLLARAGDLVPVGPGDLRRIAALGFSSGSGGEDGRPRGLNDDGLVAFRVRFTDGTSAVLVSDALAVPEPHAIALGAATLILIGVNYVIRGQLGSNHHRREPAVDENRFTSDEAAGDRR
jgi:hypothetical protein